MADTLSLTFIINGAPYTFEFSPAEPLHAAIAHVLGETGNSGRPPADWIARSVAGDDLDQRKRLRDLGLASGGQIYLSLSAGVGG